MTNTNQHVDFEIPHGSRDLVIVPETVKNMFNLESTDKTRSIVKNVGRALITKRVLMLDLKETDMIVSSDIYDPYRDLYLSEKEHEGKLLKGIQSANGIKASVGVKKADGTVRTVATQESAIKKTFDKRFAIILDFDFFKHPVYPYEPKVDLIERLELNYSVILCSGDTAATYKLSELYPLSANPTKWSNTLKQFVAKLPMNCLSVFDHFAGLALIGLKA